MEQQAQNVTRERLDYAVISLRDPLQLDNTMHFLPQWNAAQDTERIVQVAREATEQASFLVEPSSTTALAALRDLDFLMGSLMRHRVEPLHTIPALEGQLIRLGEAAQTVPRGTLFTYAATNPTDGRQRTFTDTDEERVLIDSVTNGIQVFDYIINALGHLNLNDTVVSIDVLNNSASAMAVMLNSFVHFLRVVTHEFFTYRLRPYFEPFTIGGTLLAGPGGSQMQILAVDYMLWGCEEDDVTYQTFFHENWQYLMPIQRSALISYEEINGKNSIVSWLCRKGNGNARAAGVRLLNKIRSFRYPHRKVASDSFKLRAADAVGSGLYRPDILDMLLAKTEAAIDRLKADQSLGVGSKP